MRPHDRLNLLLIEDNVDLQANIFEYLEGRGHTLDAAQDGLSGLHLAATNRYDAIILDLNLPGLDGVELCRKLRRDGQIATPIIMLTARDSLEDKLTGFDAGSDDYLIKPFALSELEARLISICRRASGSAMQRVLAVGDLHFDIETREACRQGQPLQLTPITKSILELLMQRAPRLVRHAEIEQVVWGEDAPDKMVLRTHMSALRLVIDRPFSQKLLQTVHGEGYRLATNGKSEK